MRDIESRTDIEQLVNAFYRRMLEDEQMAYLFTEVAKLDWDHHIPLITDFWAGILLGDRTYRGNAMLKHLELHRKSPLEAHHFGRWLNHWQATIQQQFEGPKAEMAQERARQIAGLMQVKIKQL